MYMDKLISIIDLVERDYNISNGNAFKIKLLSDKKTRAVYLGSQSILKIKELKTCWRLTINSELVDDYFKLDCIKYKENAETNIVEIDYSELSEEFYRYVEEALRYSVTSYMPTNLFACCSKYVECSNAKKCLHNDLLYAKGCWYRSNLENDRIFYGKNSIK